MVFDNSELEPIRWSLFEFATSPQIDQWIEGHRQGLAEILATTKNRKSYQLSESTLSTYWYGFLSISTSTQHWEIWLMLGDYLLV